MEYGIILFMKLQQVVTVLKDTSKPVTDVAFPALSICGSGLHMNNVQKKLAKDFDVWRVEEMRNKTNMEAMKEDFEDFMLTRFQIKPSHTKGDQSINILDILDTFSAPNVEASLAANSVRENTIACEESTKAPADKSACTYSCSDQNFQLNGTKCFYVSPSTSRGDTAVQSCRDMNAELATISNQEEDQFLLTLSGGASVWIGVVKGEGGALTWQDGSALVYGQVTQTSPWGSDDPNGDGDCVGKWADRWGVGEWLDEPCSRQWKYACSMVAKETCDSKKALKDMLQKTTCQKPESNEPIENVTKRLPGIDIFLNPARAEEKKIISEEKKNVAINFFKKSNMHTLYPELFRILWESTLPCFKEGSTTEHMLLSYEMAGLEVDCSNIFTRVPTDSGMCCALNVDDSLRASQYKDLVKEMQGNRTTQKVESQEGESNGLKLVLDLHSNTVSFGTLDQQHNAFKLFIGKPAQFPMMREKSIRLEPGREHFVDLSASVVTSNKEIRELYPKARGCLYNDESHLDFYKIYTSTNCKFECRIKKAEEKFKCIPWYIPKVSKVQVS